MLATSSYMHTGTHTSRFFDPACSDCRQRAYGHERYCTHTIAIHDIVELCSVSVEITVLSAMYSHGRHQRQTVALAKSA